MHHFSLLGFSPAIVCWTAISATFHSSWSFWGGRTRLQEHSQHLARPFPFHWGVTPHWKENSHLGTTTVSHWRVNCSHVLVSSAVLTGFWWNHIRTFAWRPLWLYLAMFSVRLSCESRDLLLFQTQAPSILEKSHSTKRVIHHLWKPGSGRFLPRAEAGFWNNWRACVSQVPPAAGDKRWGEEKAAPLLPEEAARPDLSCHLRGPSGVCQTPCSFLNSTCIRKQVSMYFLEGELSTMSWHAVT